MRGAKRKGLDDDNGETVKFTVLTITLAYDI